MKTENDGQKLNSKRRVMARKMMELADEIEKYSTSFGQGGVLAFNADALSLRATAYGLDLALINELTPRDRIDVYSLRGHATDFAERAVQIENGPPY